MSSARILFAVAATALALVLAGCGTGTANGAAPGQLFVVTTTTQLTDFAREIGGPHVKVYGILKANIDPHDYEPSPADVDALARADVVLQNGVGLEKWFASTIKAASPRGAVVDTSRGVVVHDHDPHIWHDPRNAMVMCENVARSFEHADPKRASSFRRNLASYTNRLDALDRWNEHELGALTNKRLVTNHDAFGYYVERYGLDYVGSIIPSFDSSAELSARDVRGIVNKIERTGVKAVFSETSLPPKTAEAIGKEAGVRVVAGEGALYGDTLGPPGSDGATYLQAEQHNTKVIVANLR